MGMDGGGGGGGGKLPYSYAAHQHQQDGKQLVVKSFSRVEPRKFGLGLVAGFLLVTCAYFSTAKFDAIHIAMISPISSNAAGIGSPVTAADTSSKQQLDSGRGQRPDALSMSEEGSKAEVLEKDDGEASSSSSGPDSGRAAPSLEDTRRGEAFVGDDSGDASGVAAASSASANPAAKGDDDAPVLAPVSSEEATNSTQESGVLEDGELQVQDAIANPSKKNSDTANAANSSNGGSSPSVIHSDPAVLPAPAQQIPPASQEVKAPAGQKVPVIPEVKQADSGTPQQREWKPLCDVTSNRRIDWCELDGDVRVLGANASVTLVAPPGADERAFREESWRIKPYPRKADPNAMRFVRVVTVQSVRGEAAAAAAACTDRHGDVPALVFSDRGYTGNYFHAFTDVILPLFLTARQYGGEVRLLVADFQMWWLGKFLPVFKSISNYELIDLDKDPRVHCFRHVQPRRLQHRPAPRAQRLLHARLHQVHARHLRAPARRRGAAGANATSGSRWRPRLLVISRARTRRFVNLEEVVRGAEKVGFEVVVSEGGHEVAPFAEQANSCDAIMGVHGAGLTNMVFVPTGGVAIQVVPLGGLEFVASYFRGPSRDMGLRYLEYRITPEESTLIDQFPRDHPIFTDPDGVKSKGWDSLKDAYLDKQDVRLDMKRFRPTLKKAIAHLRKKQANGN
ncbi:hypothetical protein U9M48_020543 [Paspalum notatum var. saurae]|uniref:Glycosyltransferase 61 catalytic domain-containing protein n=1 Tax=Paspalum notatum var. saurae TaxID=547442 RepID=A0AAQ3TH16_PASNO